MKTNAFNKQRGWIEVICGPMFAGKSEELLRQLNRLKYADVNYVLFKPQVDTRTKNNVQSRDGRKLDAITVKDSFEIRKYLSNLKKLPNVVAIDEVQFFDDDIVYLCDNLAREGVIVYAAGLDSDFKGEPFNVVGRLMCLAEVVIKLTAICTECGAHATRSQRLIDNKPASFNSPTILIGNVDYYCARCRHHHEIKDNPNLNRNSIKNKSK